MKLFQLRGGRLNNAIVNDNRDTTLTHSIIYKEKLRDSGLKWVRIAVVAVVVFCSRAAVGPLKGRP